MEGEELPVFQLNELVDELARSSDEEGEGDMDTKETKSALRELKQGDSAKELSGPAEAEGGVLGNSAGERTASAFWCCAQEQGFTAFADALTFCGLRDEMPRLSGPGLTIIAPTNEAFAQMAESARADQRVVRQLLLGHMCSGASSLVDLKTKNCAVAVAGQTHAVYEEAEHTYVGTGRFGRTDLAFDGGYIHEITSVLMVLSLVRDSHSEQVWKKSLQPSPILSAIGGVSSTGSEYEVHGCLLHAATGQLVPEALRGHVRAIKPFNEEQRLPFTEITVLTKPPSLAKRRGVGQVDGSNRYRLLFSIWNTSSLSYISWQHMATPLVVRNSFHMLPIEEKNYRRTQYARARGRPGAPEAGGDGVMPSVPEGEASAMWLGTDMETPTSSTAASEAATALSLPPLTAMPVGAMPPLATQDSSGLPLGLAQVAKDAAKAADDGMDPSTHLGLPPDWLPLSQAPVLPGGAAPPLPKVGRERAPSVSSSTDDISQDLSFGASFDHRMGDAGRDPMLGDADWMRGGRGMMEPQTEYAQLQAMAQHHGTVTPASAAQAGTAAGKPVPVTAVAAVPAVPVASSPFTTAAPATAFAAPAAPIVGTSSGFTGNMGAMPSIANVQQQQGGEFTATTIAVTAVATAPPMLSHASASSVHSGDGSFGAGGAPRLVDASAREGSTVGGTVVWLHGENFTHDLTVRFGGAAATNTIVSHNLIKCKAPPFAPLVAQQRHEVAITLVVTSTNLTVVGSIPFAYVVGQPVPGSSPTSLPGTSLAAPSSELLLRLLTSLERAQAATAAAASGGSGDGSAMSTCEGGASGLAAFGAMDEHGYTLAEYAYELRAALGEGAGSKQAGDASELHMQHQDLAALVKRERLSASLAKRPSLDLLQQRNILPNTEEASQRRQSLLHSLANRPAVEQLQQRNILHTADPAHEQEQLAKRKRLEGFLAERPTPEQFQAQFNSNATMP